MSKKTKRWHRINKRKKLIPADIQNKTSRQRGRFARLIPRKITRQHRRYGDLPPHFYDEDIYNDK